jgi:hypothetical protein
MTATATLPRCTGCSDATPRWEILSPVAAEDRVRLDGDGIAELGLFAPDGGLEPLGRPVVRCLECGTPAHEDVAQAVLRAAVVANRGTRTPGDA